MILVNTASLHGEVRCLAAIITISPVTIRRIRGIRSAPHRKRIRQAWQGAYYLSPAEKGGEPPGRWMGASIAELGFRNGQAIDREVFERLYGHFLDPRDPDGDTRLGQAPQQFRSAEEIHGVLLAMEPDATAERRAELLIEAKQQVRFPVQYFDVTFSVSKSITLLHAFALANAEQNQSSQRPGNRRVLAASRRPRLDLHRGREPGGPGLPATGSRLHPLRRPRPPGNGITSGRWEDAHQWVIGSFPQHTSQDGGAAAAIAALVTESKLSREFGTGWSPARTATDARSAA